MKQHPLLLSPQMVLAYLAGRKTVTRRTPNCMNSLVDGKRVSGKKWKELELLFTNYHICDDVLNEGKTAGFAMWSAKLETFVFVSPIYEAGDWLFFRETWYMVEREGQGTGKQFLVFETEWNGNEVLESAPLRSLDKFYKWGGHPSIHLPKETTRLWAECTSCTCERVQDITEEQAKAEGILWYHDKVIGTRFKDYMADASGYGHPEHDYPTTGDAITSFGTLWSSIHGPESWQQNPPAYAINYKILSTTGKPLENSIP